MKKKRMHDLSRKERLRKTCLIMRFLALILFVSTFQLSASVYSQETRVTVHLQNASFEDVVKILEHSTDFTFLYRDHQVTGIRNLNLQYTNVDIKDVLDACLKGSGLTYRLVDNTIVIQPNPVTARDSVVRMTVRGTVKDTKGEMMPGVTIRLKGTTMGFVTNGKGEFNFDLPKQDSVVLIFSFVGYKTQEIAVRDNRRPLSVVMEEELQTMDEVVITGMFTRKEESFTGSAVTFKGNDLKKVGNQKLIASLKNLDPSFIVADNLEFGSDPNQLPEITMRGRTTIPDMKGEYTGNPNQPLFILDGFETTLETVYDLDMNRVSSITLLKDAAAKAIYGAKAANGVVVIETILPKSGNLYVSYTGSLDITAPDLTSYNLTNAAEKLEAEWRANKYVASGGTEQAALLEEYYGYLKEVERGVNTYWLSKPLRTGVGQKHSLGLSGGDSQMRYDVNISYNDVKGVMKGSDRQTLSGNITLAYRYNNLNFRNNLSISTNRAENSPYGSFSAFAAMNPYLRVRDENGHLIKTYYSQSTGYYGTPNPLYNGELDVIDKTTYTTITENFYAEWTILENLRVTGRFGLTKSFNATDRFYPADHTKFAGSTYDPRGDNYVNRGEYEKGNSESLALSADVGLSYSLQKGKHLVYANALWNLESSNNQSMSVLVVGFPSPFTDYITAGNMYSGTKPAGSETKTRSIGLVGSVNYSYDNRYLFDFTYRANASSQLGTDDRWGHFWSVGLGWNIHHEKFMASLPFINVFKVRGSLGYTGSENFDPYMAIATYGYFTDKNYNGGDRGVYLLGVANTGLRGQKQYDRNLGADLTLFNKLSLRFDYYSNVTTNLLTDVNLAPSTGFGTYKENLGEVENAGYQISAQMRVYSNREKRASASISAGVAHNSNKLVKISDALRSINDEQDEKVGDYNSDRKPVVRFAEGQSMTAIWAVKSLGIDPINGQEVFVKKDGSLSYTWDTNDQIVAGDSEAKLTGNIGAAMEYMGLSLNLSFTFKYGGQTYNSTLLNKIENVDIASVNVDKRVLYDRWNTPGVAAKYKDITNRSSTYPTTRFVEDVDEFVFSAISVGYDFSELNFVKRSPIDRLRLSFNMNDIGRISTVKQERGTEYPFARTFSFSLSASF